MRTNIVIDDQLITSCMQATGIKTRRAMVDYALREVLRLKNQSQIKKLKGRVAWEGDLEEWRKGRFSS